VLPAVPLYSGPEKSSFSQKNRTIFKNGGKNAGCAVRGAKTLRVFIPLWLALPLSGISVLGGQSTVMRRLCLRFITRHYMASLLGRATPPHGGALSAKDDAG
jgi:hypothetical protein